MATSQEYIEFVCEQLVDVENVRYKKMFGEYMVYVNDKPVLLFCDNTVYVLSLIHIQMCIRDREYVEECSFPTHTEAFEKLVEVMTKGDAAVIKDMSEIGAVGHLSLIHIQMCIRDSY